MTKTPILYCDDGTEVALPFRWEICTVCEGCGTDRGASVECERYECDEPIEAEDF